MFFLEWQGLVYITKGGGQTCKLTGTFLCERLCEASCDELHGMSSYIQVLKCSYRTRYLFHLQRETCSLDSIGQSTEWCCLSGLSSGHPASSTFFLDMGKTLMLTGL